MRSSAFRCQVGQLAGEQGDAEPCPVLRIVIVGLTPVGVRAGSSEARQKLGAEQSGRSRGAQERARVSAIHADVLVRRASRSIVPVRGEQPSVSVPLLTQEL